MRVVFMGTPGFALPALERLILDGYDVVGVCTRPDRAAGRGLAPAPSPVKRAALRWRLPLLQPASLKAPEAIAGLAALRPDVIVVAAYGQILPDAVLEMPPFRCLNVHPSLLPRFRGASPVAAAILAGDEFTGASVMLIEKRLDAGPVLARAQVPISPRDTTGFLTAKLALIGALALLDVLPRWTRGQITPQPQDEAQATYARPIAKEAGEIDWRRAAVEIWRRVRAFQPWPGCYTRWRGKSLKVIEAVPLPASGETQAGKVVALPDEAGFGVVTGAGILGIVRLQLEGRRAMPAAEFLRGQREFIGSVLPSG